MLFDCCFELGYNEVVDVDYVDVFVVLVCSGDLFDEVLVLLWLGY